MNTNQSDTTLNATITQELSEELDREALKSFVTECLRARGYCLLRARNSTGRFANFGKGERDFEPGYFHACYVGIVIDILNEWGLQTIRFAAVGTKQQIGECDLYVTLKGMVDLRKTHSPISSAKSSPIGTPSNPLHLVARAANDIPIRVNGVVQNTTTVANAAHTPLTIDTPETSRRWRITVSFIVITSSLVTLVVNALLRALS